MLVQNPPSIPTLLVAQVMCLLRNTHLLIDWHNFGYSILAMKLGSSHPLVRLSKWYEGQFSKAAFANFTVTNAMARVLKEDFHVTSPVMPLHDRPPAHFQPLSQEQRLAALTKIPATTDVASQIASGRIRLVVSSTSWTPDEDFSVLLDALVDYSKKATSSHPQLPELRVVITGKGPQKEMYMSQVEALEAKGELEMVDIVSAWLSTQDYAALLGAADIGVSLHTSSSGVDLPMKVVDMFGAGIPVAGWSKFEAWPELVKEEVNGRGFGSAEGLTNILVNLFGERREGRALQRLKEGAMKEGARRWDDEWDPVAGKLLGLV